jgi:hypothetical protein
MGRRFVDAIWIQSRMNLSDARHEAEARRRAPAIRPDVVPVVEVELVPVSRNSDNAVVDVQLVPKPAESSSSSGKLTKCSLLNNGGAR